MTVWNDTSIIDNCTHRTSNADAAETRQDALYSAQTQFTGPTHPADFVEMQYARSTDNNPVLMIRNALIFLAVMVAVYYVCAAGHAYRAQTVAQQIGASTK